VISFPFDSEISGYNADGSPIYDRAADSAVLRKWMSQYFSDGIHYDRSTGELGFSTLQGSGLTAQTTPGAITCQGSIGIEENIRVHQFDAADTTYDRIDTIVMRMSLETDVRKDDLYVVKGTPASNPVPPTLTRDLTNYEMGISNIRIRKNSTQIQQADIEDTRLDTERCGVCAVPMGVFNTTDLYRQINADLALRRAEAIAYMNEWIALIQNTIDEQTEGALLNLIEENAFQTYVHTKEGTVHNLMLADGRTNIKFIATADFHQNDTFTINSEPVNAYMPDGNDLQDGYFKAGAVIIAFRNGDNVYFVGGGAVNTQVIVTLVNSDGSSAAGRTVTVTNVEDGAVIEQFEYSGQAHTCLVPVGTHYRVECSAAQYFVTPEPVEYTATANTPRAVTLTYKYGTRYGFRREKANSSPSSRITYLFDAVGMTPAYMNYSADAFSYGSWQEFVERVARPVMLKTDGTVDYELDHDDQTKRADNSEASDVTNTSYDGNAMVEFGSAFKWVKRYEDSNYEYVIFCDVQFEDDYHAYAHTGTDGTIKDAFYWGMFKGTLVSSKLRSIGTGSIMVEKTRQNEIDYCKANGDGYYTIYKSGWDYIGDLLTLISKSDNSQEAFGKGRSKSSNSAAIAAGTLKSKPAFWGSTDETSDVKVFWIEGFWGNVWEGMAGLILDGTNGIKTKMTPPYNTTGSGYDSTGVVPSGTSGGFVNTHSVTDQHGYVPKTANGSETTYMCDGLWFNTSQVDYALVGGGWDNAGKCGSRYVSLDVLASSSDAIIGSRLSFIPV